MKKLIGFIAGLFIICSANAQDKILIDQIVAVVGSETILMSDIENQMQQMVLQGQGVKDEQTFCSLLEQAMVQKMLLMQARFDSIPVSEDQVNSEMERRLDIFIRQAGSREKLEEALGKSVDEIKLTFAKTIEEQLLIQAMQSKITSSARVTPGEVRKFFNKIPKDSLPYIPSEVKIGQLVLKPPVQQSEKDKVIKQLNEIKLQIEGGSSFSLKAKLYSEDYGSAAQGGELGLLRREDLVENFAAAGFNLEGDSISDVIETEFGYHIIQLIEKRGEYANFRHILIKPKVLTADIYVTLNRLDSIYKAIRNNSISFSNAAQAYSTDENTKNNGGLLVNPINGGSTFTMDELAEIDGATFRAIEDLEPGEITEPKLFDDQGGVKVVKILYIVSKKEPHVASLETDYSKIQQAALADKQAELLSEWVQDKKDDFYVKIASEYKNCKFTVSWFNEKTQ
jgi:peptidyl-prolyl cis-trans isomerase SurA